MDTSANTYVLDDLRWLLLDGIHFRVDAYGNLRHRHDNRLLHTIAGDRVTEAWIDQASHDYKITPRTSAFLRKFIGRYKKMYPPIGPVYVDIYGKDTDDGRLPQYKNKEETNEETEETSDQAD